MVARERRGIAFVGLVAFTLVIWLGLNRVGWGTDLESPATVNAGTWPTLVLNQTDLMGNPPQQWSFTGTESFFFIKDATFGRTPFVIKTRASDPRNNGAVGLGVLDPQQRLHILDGDMPTLRLDQDASAGYPKQSWDLSSSELGFEIIDVTHYRRIPFTIQPNAPTDSFFISETAQVGLGTSLPRVIGGTATSTEGDVRHLNLKSPKGTARSIVEGNTAAESYLVQTGGPANQRILRSRVINGKYFLSAVKDNLTSFNEGYAFTINLSNGNVGIKTISPVHPLQVGDPGDITDGNGARCTTGGVWTNASSRDFKQDIEPITSAQARDTVRALQPVGYRYKNELDERYVGFIAEDVPELVATNDRKGLAPMDIVGVLTKVVQDQDRELAEERQRNDKLERMVESLMRRMTDLEQRGGGAAPAK